MVPVHELPLEILCMIFDHYLGGLKVFNDVTSMKSGPGIRLSHVSRNWRRASWGYAPFWSHFLLHFSRRRCPCRSVQTEDFETTIDTFDKTDDGWTAWKDFVNGTKILNVAKPRGMLEETEVPSNMPKPQSQARYMEVEPPHLATSTGFHPISHLPCSSLHKRQAEFLDFILSMGKPVLEVRMGNFAPFGSLQYPGYGQIVLIKRISRHLNSIVKLTTTTTLLKYLSPDIQRTGLPSLRWLEFYLPEQSAISDETPGCDGRIHGFQMAPHLDTVDFCSVPPCLFSFRSNNLRHVAYSGNCISDCLEVLFCCRNLESFVFNVHVEAEPVDSWSANSAKITELYTKGQIECTNLNRLVVKYSQGYEYGLLWMTKILSLLGSLTLPSLEELYISGYVGHGWDQTVVNRLLERSGCSLTKLSLSCLDIPTNELLQTLAISPNLVHLDLIHQQQLLYIGSGFEDPPPPLSLFPPPQLIQPFVSPTFLPHLTSMHFGCTELGVQKHGTQLRDRFAHRDFLRSCLNIRAKSFRDLGERSPLEIVWIDSKDLVDGGTLDRQRDLIWGGYIEDY